jgi:hypothetical protein
MIDSLVLLYHVGEQVFTCNNSFKLSIYRTHNRQLTEVHQPEESNHFGQAISSFSFKWLIYDVVRKVYYLVLILFTDINDLLCVEIILRVVDLICELFPINLGLI